MDPEFKPVEWVGTALDDLRRFPDDARRASGFQIGRVQAGRMPHDWKPMAVIGPGVNEIRVRTGREHRVLYVIYAAKFADAACALHAFEKKAQRTNLADIEIGRRRYRELLRQRREA